MKYFLSIILMYSSCTFALSMPTEVLLNAAGSQNIRVIKVKGVATSSNVPQLITEMTAMCAEHQMIIRDEMIFCEYKKHILSVETTCLGICQALKD